MLPSTVQHPSAALPQVFGVPPRWTNVPLMAHLKARLNPTLSALFTSQVPLTAQFTPMPEIRAHLNAPFIQWTRQQTVPSTLEKLMAAHIVPSTTQGRRQTARYTRQGLRILTATKTAPCLVKVARPSLPMTAHFTTQGFKLASVPQNQIPRMKRWKQGTIKLGTKQGETQAA